MENKRTIPEWGRLCKAGMALKGKTMHELADKINRSYNHVSSIINCKREAPPELVDEISDYLGVDPSLYPWRSNEETHSA